jgi:hypothetical protein
MLIAEARITTERPSRYLAQFCRHAAALGSGRHGPWMHPGNELARGEVQVHADWTDTHATLTFNPWGRCTITAETNTLMFRAQATNGDDLERIQDVISRDLERFGRRAHLTMTWHRPVEQATPGHDRPAEGTP